MKKRYTAAMLVAAMLMMNPKLPIRASHAHAEGEEEQTNEANSSEQPGAQTKVIWKKNGARGEVPAETESGEPNASTEDENISALPLTPVVVWPEPGEATPGEISREGDEDEITLPILEDEERPVADGEVTYSSLSMTRQSTWRPWRKRWGKTTSA